MNILTSRISRLGILHPVLLTLCFLSLIIPPSIAEAYSYLGVRWWGSTVYMRYDASVPASWRDSGALARGRQVWNSAGSRFRIYYAASSANLVKAGYYGQTNWLARANTTINLLGYITKATIEFNRSHPWSISGASGCYDVQNISAHEFGHWLQLRDIYSSTDYWKTMYGNAGMGEMYKRTLHTDDIAGIKRIYGI